MKHLFYIHSNITYLVAKGVINYHQIKKEEVILVFGRNIEPLDKDRKSYKTHILKEMPSFDYYVNFLKGWLKLYQFKSLLNGITNGEKYFAYVPQTKNREFQILIHNNMCEGFSIIEEGTDSYLSKEKLLKQHKPRQISLFERISYLNLVKSNAFIQEGYENLYGISEHSFPEYERKIILDNVLSSYANNANLLLDNKNILILDAISYYGDISIETHLNSVRTLIDYFITNGISEVYYKYHPSQINSEEEVLFENLFEEYTNKLSFLRLDDNLIVEHLLTKSKNLTLFVNISSLGMYANVFGHSVNSYIQFAIDEEERLARFFECYPEHYLENLHFLN